MKSVRIGMGAGYALDWVEPAIEVMEKGNVDYIGFECLGERTMAWAMLDKIHNPNKGYNSMLDYRMDKVLDVYKKQGYKPKIISNMGGANPVAAVERIAEMAREKGITGLKICTVEGDDLLGKVDRFMDLPTIEKKEPLSTLKEYILSVNAYTGVTGIIEGLKAGADIIIAGRVADPSLVLAPAIYELGWKMDDWDLLGCGTIAGHLIECSSQVTGGYFADPDYGKVVPDLWRIGYPIAEIYENGDIIITKVEGSGGMVTEETVKEQLGYEIQNPARYLTPDCVADFTHLVVKEIGKDCVLVTGGKGTPKTGLLKVNIGYRDCYMGEGEITFSGPTCIAKAKLAAEIVKNRLALTGVQFSEIRYDFIGINSIFGEKLGNEWSSGTMSECRLRVAARTPDALNAIKVGWEIQTLPMAGPAGGGAHRNYVKETLSIASILVDEKEVPYINSYVEV